MKQITCERCGKKELRKYNSRFCLECAAERHRAWRKHEPSKQKCAWCGKEFTRTHPRQIYCSAECSKAANRLNASLNSALRRKCAKK